MGGSADKTAETFSTPSPQNGKWLPQPPPEPPPLLQGGQNSTLRLTYGQTMNRRSPKHQDRRRGPPNLLFNMHWEGGGMLEREADHLL